MKLNLKRQKYNNPDFEELKFTRMELENIIKSDIGVPNFDLKSVIPEIVRFQDEDGSFNLLDSYNIECDCRICYCHEPTYICTALLLKAYMTDPLLFEGKEEYILSRALKKCCERGLKGHGYNSLAGLINAVGYFVKCDVKEFLNRYPNICPEFTNMFQKIQEYFDERVKQKSFYAEWGECFEREIRDINTYFTKARIFVYGTLLRGQCNHQKYLGNSSFIGDGVIEGYDMYDFGGFPGMIIGTGKVYGEVYSVTADELKKIDRLESEGTLYKRVKIVVCMSNKKEFSSYAYVYLNSVEKAKRIYGKYGKNMVWYVAYGSNMLEERLRYYINGGVYAANGKLYSRCRDTNDPIDMQPAEIPYDMFYSNYNIGSWSNSAVCFIDITKAGKAYGRAYLVTEEQLVHIHNQEGIGQNWYPEKVYLNDIDGIPAYTFAGGIARKHEPFVKLSSEYGIILYRGLQETHPELSENEIIDYLRACGSSDGCQ